MTARYRIAEPASGSSVDTPNPDSEADHGEAVSVQDPHRQPHAASRNADAMASVCSNGRHAAGSQAAVEIGLGSVNNRAIPDGRCRARQVVGMASPKPERGGTNRPQTRISSLWFAGKPTIMKSPLIPRSVTGDRECGRAPADSGATGHDPTSRANFPIVSSPRASHRVRAAGTRSARCKNQGRVDRTGDRMAFDGNS
jgi:hypothetical protein